MCLKFDIFDWEPKKWCAFFVSVFLFIVILKSVPHIWHCNALNVFFTWMNTRIKFVMSHLWKKFKGEMVYEKNICKQSTTFFLFPVLDIENSDIFLKIQKFLRMSWAPIIKTNGINFLMAGPLRLKPSPVNTKLDYSLSPDFLFHLHQILCTPDKPKGLLSVCIIHMFS